MSEKRFGPQTDQIITFIAKAMRFRRHVLAAAPEEVIRQKERLDQLRLADGPKRISNHDLFYQVGAILSRYKEPPPMGEISKALDVPLSTATRIIDDLVENGYAVRIADPGDRRVVRVALTESGRLLYQTIHDYMRQRIEQVLSWFTDEERDQFIALLNKVSFNIEQLIK